MKNKNLTILNIFFFSKIATSNNPSLSLALGVMIRYNLLTKFEIVNANGLIF